MKRIIESIKDSEISDEKIIQLLRESTSLEPESTALELESEKEQKEQKEFKQNGSILIGAALFNRMELMRYMIKEKEAYADYWERLSSSVWSLPEGNTSEYINPLLAAIFNQNDKTTRYLLENGAMPGQKELLNNLNKQEPTTTKIMQFYFRHINTKEARVQDDFGDDCGSFFDNAIKLCCRNEENGGSGSILPLQFMLLGIDRDSTNNIIKELFRDDRYNDPTASLINKLLTTFSLGGQIKDQINQTYIFNTKSDDEIENDKQVKTSPELTMFLLFNMGNQLHDLFTKDKERLEQAIKLGAFIDETTLEKALTTADPDIIMKILTAPQLHACFFNKTSLIPFNYMVKAYEKHEEIRPEILKAIAAQFDLFMERYLHAFEKSYHYALEALKTLYQTNDIQDDFKKECAAKLLAACIQIIEKPQSSEAATKLKSEKNTLSIKDQLAYLELVKPQMMPTHTSNSNKAKITAIAMTLLSPKCLLPNSLATAICAYITDKHEHSARQTTEIVGNFVSLFEKKNKLPSDDGQPKLTKSKTNLAVSTNNK